MFPVAKYAFSVNQFVQILVLASISVSSSIIKNFHITTKKAEKNKICGFECFPQKVSY